MKYLIFDAGALINFTSNSLLSVFEELKKIFPGEFLITKEIKHETIEHPLKVKRFEWGALRIKQLLDRGIIKLAEGYVVEHNELQKETKRILEIANSTFITKHKALHIIDLGEAEVLALSKLLTQKGKENAIVIDERTARVLVEKPENLRKLLKKKLHTDVNANSNDFDEFRGFDVIRSVELAFVAYKNGFIEIKDRKALEAVTYALKFGGCSISEKEVQAIKRMR
jgi:hypothetical protein